MNLHDGDVVWWEPPYESFEAGVYRVLDTPENDWNLIVIESKLGFYTVAKESELEKLNILWD